MKVSVCMIVRNEEAFLAQALASTRGLADEIVIVDTGSTDGTVALAEALGARVLLGGDWLHNAASRNLGLDAATGDWLVILDADETIADPVAVRAYLEQTTQRAIYIRLTAPGLVFSQMRIWRKGAYRYQYRAHEVPLPVDGNWSHERTDFVWQHHQPSERWPDKLQRALKCLLLDVAENPSSSHPVYYLGRQYYYLGQWHAAIALLRRYIEMEPSGIEVAEAHRYLAECYKALGDRSGQVRELHLMMAAAPQRRDAYGLLAELYHASGRHTEALALLKAALELPGQSDKYQTAAWYGAYIYDLLARCLWYAQRRLEGLPYAQRAVELEPTEHYKRNLRWFEDYHAHYQS